MLGLRNRPGEDTLGASFDEAEDGLEQEIETNLREHLDLRLRFASAVSRVGKMSFTDALRDYTDFYFRVTREWPYQATPKGRAQWDTFARTIQSAGSQDQVAEQLVAAYRHRVIEAMDKRKSQPFWPFYYEYVASAQAIDLHFTSMGVLPDQTSGEPGNLSKERYEEQRAKLKAMFTEIKKEYPDAKIVRGASWLYNRAAYRRLYPSSYTASARERVDPDFWGGGTWGQFRTKDGSINSELREQFMQNIEHLDIEHPEAAFPYKALVLSGKIEDFYKEYGIE